MLPIVKVDWRKSSPVASRVPAISRVVRVAASSRMIGPSTQVSVPASASVRPPSSRTPEGASIVAVAPGAISVRPVPFCCPPVHKNEPDSASVPAPVSVPLVWVMGPWPVTVAPAGIVIVPKASSTGPVRLTLSASV